MLSTLKRLLFQAGVPESALEDFYTDEDMEFIRAEYLKLETRTGLKEMFQILRDGGFEVWACTDASLERVKGYFDGAGVEIARDHIISADDIKAGKPEREVYEYARERAGSGEISVFAGESSVNFTDVSISCLGLCRRQGSGLYHCLHHNVRV